MENSNLVKIIVFNEKEYIVDKFKGDTEYMKYKVYSFLGKIKIKFYDINGKFIHKTKVKLKKITGAFLLNNGNTIDLDIKT